MTHAIVDAFAAQPVLSREIAVTPGGLEDHTRLIQEAIDTCAQTGGGRVALGAGRYVSGTLVLRSGVTLHLEKEALLTGSPDVNAYLRREGHLGARVVGGNAVALIYADKAKGIGITGEGTIDGNGHLFWEKNPVQPAWVEEKKPLGTWIPGAEYRALPRPRALVLFAECEEVRIENVRLTNSPAWCVHLLACADVAVRGVTLRGALYGSNTDGIDLDACSDALVEDCDIFTGDDAIALKNTNTWGLKRPSRNITVRRCLLRSTTHGFTIGTETQADFENITFADSRIEKAGEWRTLTGIGLSVLDGAAIRGVRVSNVSISDAIGPVQIRLGNVGRGQAEKKPGAIENLLLEDVAIHRAYGNSLICGLAGKRLRNIALRRVKLEVDAVVDASKVSAEVPELDTEFPVGTVWRFLPAYGFFFRHVEGLELKDVEISTVPGEERPALLLRDVGGFVCANLSAQ